jgi:hypothetical protein
MKRKFASSFGWSGNEDFKLLYLVKVEKWKL